MENEILLTIKNDVNILIQTQNSLKNQIQKLNNVVFGEEGNILSISLLKKSEEIEKEIQNTNLKMDKLISEIDVEINTHLLNFNSLQDSFKSLSKSFVESEKNNKEFLEEIRSLQDYKGTLQSKTKLYINYSKIFGLASLLTFCIVKLDFKHILDIFKLIITLL